MSRIKIKKLNKTKNKRHQIEIFAETKRLVLREILPTDVDGMYELDYDPEVHNYLGNELLSNKDPIVDAKNVSIHLKKHTND